jgi:hypothetical protein
MKSLDLTKPITTESLLKEFESRFNMTMDLSQFNEEELQDYANHVRYTISRRTHTLDKNLRTTIIKKTK